jgi:ribonuclease HII
MEQSVDALIFKHKKKINRNKAIAFVDGNIALDISFPYKNIISGDSKSLSVACASIVAKVIRDRMMCLYARAYPGYGFDIHKGYGTKKHLGSIKRLGPCLIHRRTFAPLKFNG